MLTNLPQAAAAIGGAGWARMSPPPDDDVVAALGDDRLARTIGDLGVALDRRSLVLPGPGDASAVTAAIARRPTGPAPVTLAAIDDLTQFARVHGTAGPAWHAAQQRCDGAIASLLAALRRGDPPELWLLATGAPRRVQHTVDLVTALRRRRPPFAGRSQVRITDGVAWLQATDQHTADRWWQQLERLPFARVGSAHRGPGSNLLLYARPGHAFGKRRLLGREPHANEQALQVAITGLPTAGPLSWPELLARICLRAAALAPAPAQPPEQRRARPVAVPHDFAAGAAAVPDAARLQRPPAAAHIDP